MTRVELIVQEFKDTICNQIEVNEIVINDVDYDKLIEIMDIVKLIEIVGYCISYKIEKHLGCGVEYKLRITIAKSLWVENT